MATLEDLLNKLKDELEANEHYYYIMGRFAFLSRQPRIERIKLLMELPEVRSIMVARKKYAGKNQDLAKSCKSAGNAAFHENNYQGALNAYNDSINLSIPDTEEESLAFANRSAVLFKLGMYQQCIRDVDISLKFYPKNMYFKLLERKSECYVKLGDTTLAVECYDLAKESLVDAYLSAEQRSSRYSNIVKTMENLKTRIGDKTNSGINVSNTTASSVDRFPKISGISSKMYPCASDAFTVKYTKEHGRYAVAERDIGSGDVIMVEKPYVSVLHGAFSRDKCGHCFKNLRARYETPLPCRNCVDISFCCEICRDEACSQYHNVECSYSRFFDKLNYPLSLVSLRVILKAGLKDILLCEEEMRLKSLKDSGSVKSKLHRGHSGDGTYRSDDYKALCNLVHHEKSRTSYDIYIHACLAMIILSVLEQTDFFEGSKDVETDKAIVASHILHVLNILTINITDLKDLNLTDVVVDEPHLFRAIYTTYSLLNNSCNPNAFGLYYNNSMVLRSIYPIKRGEAITIQYRYDYRNSSTKAQREYLKSRYFFTCQCEACAEDWYTKVNTPGFLMILKIKCPKCSTVLFVQADGNCPITCKCDVWGKLKEIGTITHNAEYFNRAQIWNFTHKELVAKLKKLKNELDFLHEHIVSPSSFFIIRIQMLMDIYIKMAIDFN